MQSPFGSAPHPMNFPGNRLCIHTLFYLLSIISLVHQHFTTFLQTLKSPSAGASFLDCALGN
jgi:hypothetical protein